MNLRLVAKSKIVLFGLLVLSQFGAVFAARECLLIMRPNHPDFEQVASTMKYMLREEMFVAEVFLHSKPLHLKKISKFMAKYQPKLVVLMDNYSCISYKLYQEHTDDATPVLIMMTPHADEFVAMMEHAAGISYEVQGITSLVSLRALLQQPIKVAGVIHMQEMRSFIDKQREQCRKENIEIVNVSLDSGSTQLAQDIMSAIKTLNEEQKIDVLWVLNDHNLLAGPLLEKAWLPAVRNSLVPILVGVRVLVSEQIGLGHIAIVPDHFALGHQAAEMIFDIREKDWRVDHFRLRYPLSIVTILNSKALPSNCTLRRDAHLEIDELIK